jgi:endonuclease/exonuclease/phosphatase (EEP) superfamily protein YafD
MTQEKGFNLDHIFIRGGVVSHRQVEETDWSISDHRPVWAVAEF